MKEIHWMHNFERDGWAEMGYTTIWRGRCKCGATHESIDIKATRGKSPTWQLVVLFFIALLVLPNIFFYMYVSGIYPFRF